MDKKMAMRYEGPNENQLIKSFEASTHLTYLYNFFKIRLRPTNNI